MKFSIMEFSILDDALEQMERDLQGAPEIAPPEALLALSWHLRQRDTQRSLLVADQVHDRLAQAGMLSGRETMVARLNLVRGEAKWLAAEFAAAKILANQALQDFAAANDRLGVADAHLLLASIAFDEDNIVQREAEKKAVIVAIQNIDPVRNRIADPELAMQSGAVDADYGNSGRQVTLCWHHFCMSMASGRTSDYVSVIRHGTLAHTIALSIGQIRLAIIAAIHIGESFANLNDYDAALEWMQLGMDLARRQGWPIVLGVTLAQTAGTMLRLQRVDAGCDLLREALALLAPVTGTRYHIRALRHMGDIELESGEYADALRIFQLMDQYATKLNRSDLCSIARRGQAHALSALGRPQAALLVAHAALVGDNLHAHERIVTFKVIANIHAAHSLPPPSAMCAASPALHYLQQALDLAARIDGYAASGDLLDCVASEQAKVGRYDLAYQFALQADVAREKSHSLETGHRAIAIQIKHQTEQVCIDREHQRQLAASEAQRAQALQQIGTTLEHLSMIGQEIAAQLDLPQIFDVIKNKVHQVPDISSWGIYLLDQHACELQLVCSVQADEVLLPASIALDDPVFDVARCARERREIRVDHALGEPDPRWIFPCAPTLSRLYAPLLAADKVLGVLTVHSFQPEAYGESEQLFFRTLAAYTAIAISNAKAHGELAHAHRLLQESQQHLLLQEKMAGLGTLTAGVAHEINNPTNFVHVAAQNMRVDLSLFEQFLSQQVEADDAPEMVKDFARRFGNLNAHITILLNGTQRIKSIVQDLRRFTRLDEANKKRVRLSECLLSTLNLVRSNWLEKVEFITEFNADPEIECWPALLNQAFMNLLVNACQAIQEKRQQQQSQARGELWLRLNLRDQPVDGSNDSPCVEISFEDNGVGIAPEAMTHILEPFYSGGAGGRAGLGLSSVQEIVQKHGGSLVFDSTLGLGSCFTINLPV
jgi:signal transduction histidine kinase